MKKILIIFMFLIFLHGCNKEENSPRVEAEVIAFNSNKCMCCWGWDMKIGDTIIRTESGILANIVGYEITKPVAVLVELGNKMEDCSGYYSGLDFYEITFVKKID